VSGSLTIGEFARLTHLTVKALRHYHDVGLLEPARIDGSSGYRRYDSTQVAAAQLVKRLRELDMPLPDVKAVLAAPDAVSRGSSRSPRSAPARTGSTSTWSRPSGARRSTV